MANEQPIYLNFDKMNKGGNIKMDKAEIGMIKIRFTQIHKPLELVYPTMKFKIQYDERGVAEVPEWVAKKLLGKDFAGMGYELFKEEPVKEKPERKAKVQEEKAEIKTKEDFLAEIKN
jgi:hypothetical protein